jgi:hypothetical protein
VASAAYERRNARARELGFRNYYEQRTRRTPGAGKPSSEELRLRRGHSSVGDFERLLHTGKVELVNLVQVGPDRYELLVTTSNGKQRRFTVRGRQVDRLKTVLRRPEAGGPEGPAIVGSPKAIAAMLADLAAEEAEAADAAREADNEAVSFGDDDIPF